MSTGPLPRHADIRKFTLSGTILEGEIKVSELERLSHALADDSGVLAFSLSFGRSEEGFKQVTGNIKAAVHVKCERCLEKMATELSSTFTLGVAHSDEKARQLPERLEPLVVEGETVDTQMIVEDEALLLVPIVSYHPEETCKVKAGYVSADESFIETAPEEERENPFKVLEALKKSES